MKRIRHFHPAIRLVRDGASRLETVASVRYHVHRYKNVRATTAVHVCRRFSTQTAAHCEAVGKPLEWNAPPLSSPSSSLLTSHSKSSQFIDVTPLADQMRARVRQYTQALATTTNDSNSNNNKVRLVGILAQHDDQTHDEALLYSQRIAETLAQDGIDYQVHCCQATSRDAVEAAIQEMNQRHNVHGILVFYPIFQGRRAARQVTRSGVYYKTDDDYLRDVVDPSKDVEGLRRHSNSTRHMFRARRRNNNSNNNDNNVEEAASDVYIPCTALAVTRILDAYARPVSLVNGNDNNDNNDNENQSSVTTTRDESTNTDLSSTNNNNSQRWTNCTITIINRSEILGRPLAALLALQGATVYSVDETSILVFSGGRLQKSKLTKADCLRQSSIVVTGVPSPSWRLPTHLVPEGALVVNVSGFANMDDEEELAQRSIQYVPQVGKVTVAALEENLIRLHQRHVRSQQPPGETT